MVATLVAIVDRHEASTDKNKTTCHDLFWKLYLEEMGPSAPLDTYYMNILEDSFKGILAELYPSLEVYKELLYKTMSRSNSDFDLAVFLQQQPAFQIWTPHSKEG